MPKLDDDGVRNVQVGIIGSGSMGAGMTLLFAEKGSNVACFDTSSDAVKTVLRQAQEDPIVDETKVSGFTKLDKLVASFPRESDKSADPRILVLSLPHGSPADEILDQLSTLLDKGDVVVDCGNEWWADTERRQDKCKGLGIHWIGCGVSGGYQAARHGPSMSPGGSKEAYAVVEPYLRCWAAKTPSGDPCVEYMGPGGAGHYIKMVHNGIEHAQLSILCEVRAILHTVLGLSNDTIAQVFEEWNESGPLRGNFLVGIGFKGLRFKSGDGIEDDKGIVEDIEDKVTQDVDRSEGTGTWSARESMNRHVACPAIAAAHTLRIISADKFERLKVVENLSIPQPQASPVPGGKIGKELNEMFEQATYGAFFGAFIQGMELITRASKEEEWGVSLARCMRIWKAGCIIQSDAISELLLPILKDFGPSEPLNLLKSSPKVASELSSTFQALKSVCLLGVQRDAVIPALSASLEWIKSVGGKDLPTNFQEMELDYFGHHNYDVIGKTEKGANKGKYHTEFKST